jgi:CHAT domain-containing protein
MTPRAARTILWSGLILAIGVFAGVFLGAARGRDGLLHQLAREARGNGTADLRLSVVSGLRPCAAHEAGCPGPTAKPSARALAVIRRAVEAARAGVDPDALHAAALANLLYSGGAGNLLDQSISYLQTAARLTEQPAPVLADLAGAHLTRARYTGSAWELYQALEAAERALEHEPRNATALFNAAAALDAMHLPGQADQGWTRYLEVDSTSGWAREARRRRALAPPAPRPATPDRTASTAVLEAFAAAEPTRARELGWDDLLREWGGAVLAGDSAVARLRLRQAEVLGAALVRRGGDASLADAVQAIRRYGGRSPGLAGRARAHVDLAEGRRAMLDTKYAVACPRLQRALTGDSSSPLREWGQAYLGFCSIFVPADYKVDLVRLAEASDTARYPAAAGRRWMALASFRYRGGHYPEALAAYGRAEELFRRAGERENAYTARMNLGNTRSLMGQAGAGYALLDEALDVLSEHPGVLGLWNGLYALRNALLADGLSRAAMRVQDEAVAVSRLMPASLQAETHLARARLHLAAGKRGIDADLGRAVEIIETVDKRFMEGWLRADLQLTRAEAWMSTRPDLAVAELDSVVAYFRASAPRQLPALFSRAQAWLAMGMQDSAGADLGRAIAALDGQRARVSSARLRAELLEKSRRVFDQAVMLSVAAGRTEEALDYVERSRSSFSPVAPVVHGAARPLRAPPGEVALELALVADTLLAWTLWDGGLHLTRRTVRSAELVRTAERVRSALELRAPDSVALAGLQALYDELVRPLGPRLGPAGTPLTIVADGELAGVPMAALHDRVRGRYLVEDHPVRFASSLRDPSGSTGVPQRVPVTLVADPLFDRGALPELQPLAGAVAEVQAIARLHPRAGVMEGTAADTGTLRAAFRRGGIVHFAGHAVFDDARPERSFLVAAGAGPHARLTAAEIEGMTLGSLRLVVLSACQTARTQAGRSGGFAGLAGAFLAAGAGGVVGSLWRVDDQATRALMERFHAAYLTSGDPTEALRQAQLQMLRSANPGLRSPAAWAGFRYTGG